GVAYQNPAPQRARMGEVETPRQGVAEGAERVPSARGDPGAERGRPLTEPRSVRPTALGVAARRGIDPQLVDADPVALLVVLAGAVLVQQLERRRGVVVEDEERVPAVLPLHRALAHDDGADRSVDALDRGGGLGDLDLLGLGADVPAGLLMVGEAVAR